jgi:alanyl-tRNA synthetase
MRTGAEIRQDFITYFKEHQHTVVPSSSLVPAKDPSLLFTNSGMVQFKDIFLGTDQRRYTRAVNAQKCMRVAGKHNDLDDVGRDGTHHTFFEMLGNWSFGDYYKQEAIEMAWDLLTEVWKIPPDNLYVTVFKDELGNIDSDEEAVTAWLAQPGFENSHLFYRGRHDNFWEMADTGPCGPCSEIHVDLDPGKGQVSNDALNTDRFVELWNLVFIQYNRVSQDTLDFLPTSHVDTGMGLERITAILQGVPSTYHTDLLWPTIMTTQALAKHSDDERDKHFTPYRVIADHVRAATFLVADGVVPGNTNRNYVCRMIIRRASRFASEIGLNEPSLSAISEKVIETYKHAYPELEEHSNTINSTLYDEETSFYKTIHSGISHLNTMIENASSGKRNTLTGTEAFDLYATYGLPVEITKDYCDKHGFDVDQADFRKAMKAHREASKTTSTSDSMISPHSETYLKLLQILQDENHLAPSGVEHSPYGPNPSTGKLLALVSDNGTILKQVSPGQSIGAILSNTSFYMESGGQASDKGEIQSIDTKWQINVESVHRPISGLIVHLGVVSTGLPRAGDTCIASVNAAERLSTMRNHTATHILHRELRNLLGEHARQAGSSVTPDRIRFDFTHNKPLTEQELDQLTSTVNLVIMNNHTIHIKHESYDEAILRGATALFGEKYGDIVRTVQVGDDDDRYSLELCGGTHVHQTGEIGSFIVTSETSISSNTRRIEAITGQASQYYIRHSFTILSTMSTNLQSDIDALPDKIVQIQADYAQSLSACNKLELQLVQHQLTQKLDTIKYIENLPVLITKITTTNVKLLRDVTDWYMERNPTGIIVIGSVTDSSVSLIVRLSKTLVERGLNAGSIVSTISTTVNGKGGGNPTLGQGGGSNPQRLNEALSEASDLIKQILSEHN